MEKWGQREVRDMPNVAKMGKGAKESVGCLPYYCKLILYDGMCNTPVSHCHHIDT